MLGSIGLSDSSLFHEVDMPTEYIPIGVATILATNRVYALPAINGSVYSDAAATLEQSNAFDFAAKQALVFTAGVAPINGAFIRATAGTPTILLKRG
jgi:hypothetical protein